MNGQYGGQGTFRAIDDSTSFHSDLSRGSSGTFGSRDELRRENLPPSLRSSSSRLVIYHAPYESVRSHNSSLDGITNDFAELHVDYTGQPSNRRQSMPVSGLVIVQET